MDNSKHKRIPVWHAFLVLGVIPILYILKDYLHLVDILAGHLPQPLVEYVSHPRFIAFWSIVLCLHLLSTFLVIALLHSRGLGLQDIGLRSTWKKLLVVFGIVFFMGFFLAVFRSYSALGDIFTPLGRGLQDIYAINPFQRFCWIIISLSAGFCEELAYRGFGIRALEDAGLPVWSAVLLTSLAFAFIHGLALPLLMLRYIVAGLVFAGIYLYFRNLLPVMAVHSSYDLLAILIQ